MSATPASAIAIASQVRRETGSPNSIPSAAARSGASACMKRMLATEAWFSATMNEPDEIAISAATTRPPRPTARNARATRAALGDRDIGEEAEHREERAPGELGGDAGRDLTLEDSGRRPGDGGECDEEPAATMLRRERKGRGRRRHRAH